MKNVKNINVLNFPLLLILLIIIILSGCKGGFNKTSKNNIFSEFSFDDSLWIDYKELTGIGYEEGISRRDPSDIINVGDLFYIWYTKIPSVTNGNKTPLYNSGYYGTIWYAVSSDGGFSWEERGEALGKGEVGKFDSHAVFTPNILSDNGKFYLFYTAVRTTIGRPYGIFENNSVSDYTAIGLAVADSPDGPFKRIDNNPVLMTSKDSSRFDSYRVDDAALMVRDGKYWLYYKGRSMAHGTIGPSKTKMGVAFANNPMGPYIKYGKPVLDKSHEVLVWKHNDGVMSLASISSTLEFASDGMNFDKKKSGKILKNRPLAPGMYRPHLTDHSLQAIPGWGISMGRKKGDIYLTRFEIQILDNDNL
ncbi:xylosidase [Bacteroidota bacterium]